MSKTTTKQQAPQQVTETARVLATGSWYSKRDCPSNPKQHRIYKGKHFFVDFSFKQGKRKGEYLLTSRCKYCGGMVVDCPTIAL